MSKDYLKSFLIGTMLPVSSFFFMGACFMPNRNYSLGGYIFFAPISFGAMNALSLYLQRKYNLKDRERYVLISIISIFLILTFGRMTKAYHFNDKEWKMYALTIVIAHTLTYNITISYLNKLFL